MKTKTLLGSFLLIFLFSCSTKIDFLRRRENLLESKNDLGSVLGLKYLRYADVLEKNDDKKSAKYFSDLAIDAAFYGKYGKEFKEKFSDNKNLGEATICKNSFLELYKQLDRTNKTAVNSEKK